MVLFFWGAHSDKSKGLSFVYAAGPLQRSLSRVRVPWDSWLYFAVSDFRLPFSSHPTTRRVTVKVFEPASTPPTTRRVTVEVFDPASTRVINRFTNALSFITRGKPKRDHYLEQFVCYSVILCLSVATLLQLLVFVSMEICSVTNWFPRISLSVATHLRALASRCLAMDYSVTVLWLINFVSAICRFGSHREETRSQCLHPLPHFDFNPSVLSEAFCFSKCVFSDPQKWNPLLASCRLLAVCDSVALDGTLGHTACSPSCAPAPGYYCRILQPLQSWVCCWWLLTSGPDFCYVWREEGLCCWIVPSFTPAVMWGNRGVVSYPLLCARVTDPQMLFVQNCDC
jgi:hypothetical protein